MRIISLNTWAGREFDALTSYLRKEAPHTDVFCFQEVFDTPSDRIRVNEFYRANLFSELEACLKDHKGYFAPVQDSFGFDERPVDFPLHWGIAMFVKPTVELLDIKDEFIRGHRNSRQKKGDVMPRNLQYAHIRDQGNRYTVAHFHGVWTGGGKKDNYDRFVQSHMVNTILGSTLGEEILLGDFNLDPETESLARLEEDRINLIKAYGITSTRSPLYRSYDNGSRFADYALVSPRIEVKKFKVPNVLVSDHLPLVLEV